MKKTLLITSDFPSVPFGESLYLYHLFRLLPPDKVVVLTYKCTDSRKIDKVEKFKIYRIRNIQSPFILERALKPILFFYIHF